MIKKKLGAISLATLVAVVCTLPLAYAQSAGKKQPPSARAISAPVANAGVSVTCEGSNANARITINGVFKGNCPIDVMVPEGLVVVQATKPLDAVYDKAFTDRFRLGADTRRRVEVQITDRVQFSASAMARADAAIEAESARKEAQQSKELPELERAAQGGDAAAMARLGLIHERGLAGPVNFSKAIAWYARAAQAGDPAAMAAYGRRLQMGLGVPKDEAQAAALYAGSAAKGDPEGLYRMGWLYITGGAGVAKNPKQALALMKAAGEVGHPDAYDVQAIALDKAGESVSSAMQDELDRKKALANIKRAESGEDFDAMSTARREFANGRYATKNPELALKYARTAFRYYKKAAMTGDARAIDQLAYEYDYGFNTPADAAMAEQLYRQAAKLGNKNAAERLAELLR